MKIIFHTSRWDVIVATIDRSLRNRTLQIMVLAFALINTYSMASKVHFKNALVASICVAFFFSCWFIFISGCGLLAGVVHAAFTKKTGSICVHTMSLESEGLAESTEVNRSLYFYKDIGLPYQRLGVWILPVGSGVFPFREAEVTEGDRRAFIAALIERLKA